jgi:tetratricopeptide (TPR) repeat protein
LKYYSNLFWSSFCSWKGHIFSQGKLEEARAPLEKVVQAAPDEVKAQKALGDIYEKLGRIDDAMKAYKIVFLLNPSDAQIKEKLNALAEIKKVLLDVDNLITKDQYRQKKTEYSERISEMEAGLKALDRTNLEYREQGAEILDLLRHFPDYYRKADQRGKHALLNVCLDRLILRGKQYQICWKPPLTCCSPWTYKLQEGVSEGRFVVVVDDDIDPANLDEVVWAMCTRCDPERSIDIIRRTLGGPLDPAINKKDPISKSLNSRAIIEACKPFEWIEDFPEMVGIAIHEKNMIERKWEMLFK